MEKVVLVLVDGMRPDGMLGCGNKFVDKFVKASSHALDARTVMPSVTLPCHMSLFHSVDPDRHGILSNTYVPQVRPIVGLFDQLDVFGKKCGFFYTWEELRDIVRPGHVHTAYFANLHHQEDTDCKVTDEAIKFIKAEDPDFTFVYLGETDEKGHGHGWMSKEYLGAIDNAFSCIEKIYENLPDGYTLITTADHGGHDRGHGSDRPEDMTIPICFFGPRFEKDKHLENVNIKDIAVTVADLLGVPKVREWEGRSVVSD